MMDWKVRYSYLPQQFADPSEILEELRRFVPTGDFTLGKPVRDFESKFADALDVRHAIGVGSGTDAIKIPLKALGVGYGDEVITTANTFIATVGAINETGAKTVFVDCDDMFCMDVSQVEAAITAHTKAIVPVHFTGYMTDMRALMPIAEKYNLPIVEDACQGILADIDGQKAGSWGNAGAFSLHPLKNLNVWADGGVIVTNDDDMATQCRLLRNHGLIDRDTIGLLGYNSRLDSVQAIVGNWLIRDIEQIAQARIDNAAYLDRGLAGINGITLPPRPDDRRQVYHLYIVFADARDALYDYLRDAGIQCKIHYPVPLYQQQGLQHLGYTAGDFPKTDWQAANVISLPCDQHLTRDQLDIMIDTVRAFYGR